MLSFSDWLLAYPPADGSTPAEQLLAYNAWLATNPAPATPQPLITLDTLRAHLKEPDPVENPLIEIYYAAALGHIDGPDGWLGRALTPQTIVQTFDDAREARHLPYPPLIEVIAVTARGAGRLWSPLAADRYTVDEAGLHTDSTAPIRVTWRAGYDGAAGRVLPAPIKAALLLMTGDLFRNRSETISGVSAVRVDMAPNVTSLLQPLRVWS